MNSSIITEAFKDQVKALLTDQFPWVSVAISSLGPTNSLMIKLSLDRKETWVNGILENSRWGVFAVHQEGTQLKLSTVLASGCPKIRKCKVTTPESISDKILSIKNNA
jgi:hypothetical protein